MGYVNLLGEVGWNHKRLMRGSTANAAIPVRISDRSFYQRVYRIDAYDDWNPLFGVKEDSHKADRMNSCDKMRVEYLRACFDPPGHFSVPVPTGSAVGAIAEEVTMVGKAQDVILQDHVSNSETCIH